jgi:hypothetical protein
LVDQEGGDEAAAWPYSYPTEGVLGAPYDAGVGPPEQPLDPAFTAESLLAARADDLAAALWGGVRALEDCAAVERRLAARLPGELGRRHRESALQNERQAVLLRRLVLSGSPEAVLANEDPAGLRGRAGA